MSIVDPAFLLFALPAMAVLYHLSRAIRGLDLQLVLIFVFSTVVYLLFGVFASAVLLATIVVTYALSWAIALAEGREALRRACLAGVIVFNVGCLVLVKYHMVWLGGFKTWLQDGLGFAFIVPLGLSYFTIQQIGFAFDVFRRRTAPPGPVDYASYVIFFPQLAAGPIVRYRQFKAQLDEVRAGMPAAKWEGRLARGLTWFAIGAFKKAVIAEEMFRLIAPYYNLASAGEGSAVTSLITGLGATLALYFDFSGYSDMAIGIGLMFGLKLPVNFNAPFRFAHMRRFDRHWHVTFHEFLRDNVFVPLAGKNPSLLRRGAVIGLIYVLVILWHSPQLIYALWGLGAVLVLAFKLVFRQALATPAGRVADYAVSLAFLISACAVFVAPSWTAASGVMTTLFTVGPGFDLVFSHPAQTVWRLVLLGAVFVLLPFEIPTHALFGGEREADMRRLFGVTIPSWSPNAGWAAMTIALLLASLWRAHDLREVVYFTF
ncbi:MAG: MBOAT family O-acyltransferase [Oceanicaulis sp.]